MDKPEQKKLLVSLKIIIPLWVTFILIVFSIFFIFVPLLEKNILNQKREMIRNLIDTNWSLISEYDQMVKNGELELGVAQSEVLQRIRNLRYGRDGKDYFWINDMQPRMIMHPYSTHLENKDMSNLMDSNGKRLVMEFVKVVKQKGAGYVDYMWQWKDDPEKIVPKISYIRGFKPWGWMIGTGIYIEDVRNEIALIVKGLIKVFSGLLVLIIGLSSYITWQAIKSEEKHTKAEEALNKSKEGYKTIFENTGTATVIVEKNKIISMANDKFCDLSGYSREEIEGKKTWLEFVAPKDLKKMKAEHKLRILAGKPTLKTYEFRFIDKYNSIKHILLEVDLVPGTEKSVSSLLDITKRKVAEHALESSHERFLTILNSIDATIYVADMKTHEIIFVNKLMKEHFGSDMTGEICWQAFRKGTGPCSHCTNAQLVDENNRPKGVRTWQGKNPLNNKWYNNYDRAIEWTDGRIVKLQIATDITYIKNIETELHQAHKMDSIGTLAGGIAHDFNNILFPIMGYTELLMEEIPEKSPLKDTLKEIHNGTMRARDLIKQILTFSRQDISEFKLIKIQPIIEEGLKLIRSSIPATIKIEQNISSDCGIIKADPIQIHQIVMNLSTNAYHAMTDTGGKLTIDLKKVELNSKNIMNPEMKSGDYACLTIKDTGMGMDKNIIEKIFDPFFTTKKAGKGTGMGLSVVHGIVKKMNGAIQFESELSKGTEFNIYLPIEKKSIEESKSISPIKTPKQKGNEQILLVDDEEDIVTMEKRMLKNFGYQVTALTSSTEALETFHDDPNKFDIVITDMAMPNMSGEKLSAEIKKIHPDIPILLCTGYSEVMSKEKATSLGIKGFLLKPIVMEDLANKIREILDGNTPKITETKKTQETDNAYL